MIPVKPFDTYAWRWLSLLPSEGLLAPPVMLGVLRVLGRHEGEAPTSVAIFNELQKVENETQSTVKLARPNRDRNLIRYFGQYWKGTGLLLPADGEIRLTSLGHSIADGRITQGEFAAIMVQQTVLPNPRTYKPSEIAKWEAAKLRIRPFVLILEIIVALGRSQGNSKASYLTPRELIDIVIPLAGMQIPATDIATSVAKFRAGNLDISGWPNCAPESNDHRLAREFLLFLANFGLCRKVIVRPQLDERYYLDELFDVSAVTTVTTASVMLDQKSRDKAVKAARDSDLPSIIERQRVLASVLARPGQVKFRDSILKAYCKRCFLTGEEIPEVLEAAHIIPVTNGGADVKENGICLRVDIHRLFDSGNIRIRSTGQLVLSDSAAASKNYSQLPPKVILPTFVNSANVQWRDDYL